MDAARGALLVKPGPQENTVVVPLLEATERPAALLECRWVELWPYHYQLDAIEGADGRARRFDVWVDEEGAAASREANVCASLAAHPLNEAFGRHIRGPALLVPCGGASAPSDGGYSLEDWGQICKGVWSLDCDCEGEPGGDGCEQTPETCPRVRLVEANLRGDLAVHVRHA